MQKFLRTDQISLHSTTKLRATQHILVIKQICKKIHIFHIKNVNKSLKAKLTIAEERHSKPLENLPGYEQPDNMKTASL